MRVGRLQMSNLNFDQKHPIILPSDDALSVLIVNKCPQQVMHSGLQDMLNQTRTILDNQKTTINKTIDTRMSHLSQIQSQARSTNFSTGTWTAPE